MNPQTQEPRTPRPRPRSPRAQAPTSPGSQVPRYPRTWEPRAQAPGTRRSTWRTGTLRLHSRPWPVSYNLKLASNDNMQDLTRQRHTLKHDLIPCLFALKIGQIDFSKFCHLCVAAIITSSLPCHSIIECCVASPPSLLTQKTIK